MEHFYSNIQGWFTYPNLYSKMVARAPDNALFVEIGAWKGCSTSYLAVEIINAGKQINLDVIDTWKGSVEHNIITEEQQEALYREFLQNTSPVKHLIRPIRTTSLQGSKLYEDNSLDFVFIDASHTYEDVIVDINSWFPKVKQGGYIGGHDYGHPWIEVQDAVDTFFKNIGKVFEVTEYSWLYHKT